jgi:hypothetical protein
MSESESTTTEKKGLRLIKLKAFDDWRKFMSAGEDAPPVSISTEAREYVDEFLLNSNWNKLVAFQFEHDCTEKFPLNMNFFHKHAREEFGLTSVPLRDRLANTLSYLAAACLDAAFKTVLASKKSRIMPAHLQSVSTMLVSIMRLEWVGADPPARKKSEKKEEEPEEPPMKKAKMKTKKQKAETDSVE